jgi:outer membrane protein assembly factor BamB
VALRNDRLLALDRRDGSEAWKAEVPGRVSAAPGVLVVRDPEGRIQSLQPRTGGARWTTESGVRGDLPAVIDRDVVFVAGQGLAALDAPSGRLLWSVQDGTVAASLPVSAGARLFVGEADGTLRCRDRATGVSLWTFKTASALVAPVRVDEKGDVYVGTTDRRLHRLSGRKGRPEWTWKTGADVTTPAALMGPLALFTSFDATLYAIQRGSGKQAFRAGLPSRPLSGALLAGSTALVACHENEIAGYATGDGRSLGSLKLPAEMWGAPVLAGGRLYVGLRDRSVMALQLAGLESSDP